MHWEMFPNKKEERRKLLHTFLCILLTTSRMRGNQEEVDKRKDGVGEKTSHD